MRLVEIPSPFPSPNWWRWRHLFAGTGGVRVTFFTAGAASNWQRQAVSVRRSANAKELFSNLLETKGRDGARCLLEHFRLGRGGVDRDWSRGLIDTQRALDEESRAGKPRKREQTELFRVMCETMYGMMRARIVQRITPRIVGNDHVFGFAKRRPSPRGGHRVAGLSSATTPPPTRPGRGRLRRGGRSLYRAATPCRTPSPRRRRSPRTAYRPSAAISIPAIGIGVNSCPSTFIDRIGDSWETMAVMKYEIDLPGDVEQALERRASATGEDVVHLIQTVVVSVVRADTQSSLSGRRPDPPLDALETSPPCELPRTSPRAISVEQVSRRRPDAIADSL